MFSQQSDFDIAFSAQIQGSHATPGFLMVCKIDTFVLKQQIQNDLHMYILHM